MSPRQQALVLEQIAERIWTLNCLLIEAQGVKTDSETTVLINAAQAIAEAVGAMADDAVGGCVAGGFHSWLYGPLFATAASKGDAA